MVAPREAVQAAIAFATDIYGGVGQLPHLRVEEINLSPDEKVWNVTLGWDETAVARLQSLLGLSSGTTLEKLPRVYKVFKVDAENGKVLSMHIRENT